jgi:hypothetical protein
MPAYIRCTPMRERDEDILRSILSGRGGFGHREHLELAWNYLDVYEPDEAHDVMASAIRQLARLHGAPDKYHETITRCWVHLVAVHRASSEAQSFDRFIGENGGLLDSRLLARHYSPELISSPGARASWTEPDLRELPQAG